MKKIIAPLLFGLSELTFAMQLDIDRAQIRANIPGSDNTAAYFSAENLSKKDARIIGAHSDIAEFTELHSHTMNGDTMLMRKVDYVDVDAGDLVRFAPNGYHIMLINLKSRAKHGEKAEITLNYKDGTSQVVEFDIIDPRNTQ